MLANCFPCSGMNPGAYYKVWGGVLSDKNTAKLLNKVKEVWYQSFIFDVISDNVLQIFTIKKKIISQFCWIGKDCDWIGDRLSKNNEKLLYLH